MDSFFDMLKSQTGLFSYTMCKNKLKWIKDWNMRPEAKNF